MRINSVGEPET
uniref:Uncharacterized protein n=1 Tax=Anguilla anguilla TaxID=7936 RepID=A0A0E9PT54_ANGAN